MTSESSWLLGLDRCWMGLAAGLKLMACRWNTMTTMVFHCPCVDDFRGAMACVAAGCFMNCGTNHREFTTFAVSWGKILLLQHCCWAFGRSRKKTWPWGDSENDGWKHQQLWCNVHQCTSMYINVHQCTSMYINVHQCTSMYINVHQCTSMYHLVSWSLSMMYDVFAVTFSHFSPWDSTRGTPWRAWNTSMPVVWFTLMLETQLTTDSTSDTVETVPTPFLKSFVQWRSPDRWSWRMQHQPV